MADDAGKKNLIPSKIMAGLALTVLLGLGLCGAAGAIGQHSDKGQEILFGLGALLFWVGLLALILFGIGWVIFAICKSLFGKKD